MQVFQFITVEGSLEKQVVCILQRLRLVRDLTGLQDRLDVLLHTMSLIGPSPGGGGT